MSLGAAIALTWVAVEATKGKREAWKARKAAKQRTALKNQASQETSENHPAALEQATAPPKRKHRFAVHKSDAPRSNTASERPTTCAN